MDAAAKTHAQTPLHRLIVSTLADSKKWSNGAIRWNLHFDGKGNYCQHLKQVYTDSARVNGYIQVGYYLSNAFAFPFWRPRKDQATGE